ncbi:MULTISPECIES: ATP-dependent endonuclease [unclassified Agrobacterium]|uniref:ATP-dependent nuclease n=1 Tax=unclassified Agrobacterium TaxID=2632611 RepID=UPI0003600E7D|nr:MULTISPECIES: AAA family ATPase [unclassified Agrobacterium]SNB56905.1 ATPase/GTPase, AAA15 family [Agrobacterium sp. 719_389]
MPKIRRIAIKNFRSIVDLTMNATDLTVIVGDNDCGKSNVLRALNLFFNDETNPNSEFNFNDDYNRFAETKAKKAAEIEVEIDLELPHSYRKNNGDLIRWNKRWRADGLQHDDDYCGIRLEKRKRGEGFNEVRVEIDGRSRVPSLLSRIQFEYVPAVRSAEFFQTLRGRIFQVIANASEHSVRQSSGQLEEAISNAVSGLLQDIDTEMKDTSRLSLPNDLTPLFRSLDFLAGEKSISLDSRGDGIKARYIPLILKFIAERSRETTGIAPTFIWAYEEPENNLEFRRAQSLADAFYKLAEDELSQVLLTTHSPVFYNMHKDDNGRGLCSAYHLTREGSSRGTEARSAEEASVSLDESMGAMAIIAPHIKEAQEALAEATSQASDLKGKLEQFNQENLPTLFVEGKTDYLVFRRLLHSFRADRAEQIFLAEPPDKAGANYVANMLRSWEFRTKHLPVAQRRNAVGIVDGDLEGTGAYQRFQDEDTNWKYVSLNKLLQPPHLTPASQLGITIPVCLEELWPAQVWAHAAQQGWLVPRRKKGLFSEQLLQRLAVEDERLSDLLDDAWRPYFEQRVNDAFKSDWSSYIVGLPDADLEPFAAAHLTILDMALNELGL